MALYPDEMLISPVPDEAFRTLPQTDDDHAITFFGFGAPRSWQRRFIRYTQSPSFTPSQQGLELQTSVSYSERLSSVYQGIPNRLKLT